MKLFFEILKIVDVMADNGGGDVFLGQLNSVCMQNFRFVSPKLYRRLSSDWKQSILIFDGLVSVSFHSPGLSIAFEHGLYKNGASSNQAPIADILLASAP